MLTDVQVMSTLSLFLRVVLLTLCDRLFFCTSLWALCRLLRDYSALYLSSSLSVTCWTEVIYVTNCLKLQCWKTSVQIWVIDARMKFSLAWRTVYNHNIEVPDIECYVLDWIHSRGELSQFTMSKDSVQHWVIDARVTFSLTWRPVWIYNVDGQVSNIERSEIFIDLANCFNF